MIDVLAPDQDLATAICKYTRTTLMHYHYDGIKATGGNVGLPTGPFEVVCGQVFRFSLYHLVTVEDPRELCQTRWLHLEPAPAGAARG
jgi:hypothetical protein